MTITSYISHVKSPEYVAFSIFTHFNPLTFLFVCLFVFSSVDSLLAPDKDRTSDPEDNTSSIDESMMLTGPDGLTDAGAYASYSPFMQY
jgi:hypothetical protein